MKHIFRCLVHLLERDAMQEDSRLGFFSLKDVIHSMSYYHVIRRQFHTMQGIPLPVIRTIPKARIKISSPSHSIHLPIHLFYCYPSPALVAVIQ